MLWNKAAFCLEVIIYKRLKMWRHNDVTSFSHKNRVFRNLSTIPNHLGDYLSLSPYI